MRPATPQPHDLLVGMMALRELRIREARASLWAFCHLLEPEFYRPERAHLRTICNTLQALYERRLTKGGKTYTRLMLNIPPRLGKSRTLVNFCRWLLGKDAETRIITCSYNDEQATDFSKYTRNGIQDKKAFPYEVDYADIFPGTRIKYGDASFKQWALEGQFFSYKGAGIGAGVTGKGCNVSIVDDPVKDAETAFNDAALDTIWHWYTGTFRSRLEEGGIQIVNMTRWAKRDICGRLLDSEEAGKWYVLSMEARNEDGTMLAPDLLSAETYEDHRRIMPPEVFQANYHQHPVDIKGQLYKGFKTYNMADFPADFRFDRVVSYTDTADEGADFLTAIVAGEYKQELYLLDVLHTKDGMERTEGATAALFATNTVNLAVIESNNGGRGFARNVERILREKFNTNQTVIRWMHQTANKQARILTASAWVQEHVYVPANWASKWPSFYQELSAFRKEGRNKHDDAADALTGLAELLTDKREARVEKIKLWG